MPPRNERISLIADAVRLDASLSKSAVTTRRFGLRRQDRPSPRPSNAGAITASMNVDVSAVRRLGVERAVEADDAAERRERIGLARADVRLGGVAPVADAARIGVLDDHRGRLVELERDARGGVEIEQVRVRQLLALVDLPRAPSPRAWPRIPRAFWCGFSP